MNASEIAAELNKCANGKCNECEFVYYSFPFDMDVCKGLLIKKMGEEVRKLAEGE